MKQVYFSKRYFGWPEQPSSGLQMSHAKPEIPGVNYFFKWLFVGQKYTLFFNKNVVFPAQAEYSYSSADFRLKIF